MPTPFKARKRWTVYWRMPYGNTCRRKNGHCGTHPLCTARRTGRLWAARPYRSCCGPVPFPALWYLAAAGAAARPLRRSEAGWAARPKLRQTRTGCWSENSCTATAPPRRPSWQSGSAARPHRRGGFGTAWRRSWSRYLWRAKRAGSFLPTAMRWPIPAARRSGCSCSGRTTLTSTPGTGTCCCPTKRFRSWCGAPSAIPALSCWMAASPACGRPGPSGTGWSFPSQPGRRFRHGSKACWKYARRNTPRSAGFLF